MSDVAASAALTSPNTQPASPPPEHLGSSMWAHGSFSFKDLLDVVNPLQHLPVIGSIYRYLTGDEPAVGTRIIGDALYGGPISFGVSVVANALLTNDSGQDIGERLLAKTFGPRGHDSNPTVGAPQVAAADSSDTSSDMPAWMASVGTPDGQPATPRPGRPAVAQKALDPVACATPAVASATDGSPARSSGTPAARGIASAAAPLSAITASAAAAQPSAPSPAQAAAAPTSLVQSFSQPVAMNQLFRSAPAVAPSSPQQGFLDRNAQLQRQVSQGRGTNGAVLNGRPVPLELSSNLLPVMPAGGHLTVGPGVATTTPAATPASPSTSQAQVKPADPSRPDQNAIAQKMIDALNKYQQLKKQQDQEDNANSAALPKVDLAL